MAVVTVLHINVHTYISQAAVDSVYARTVSMRPSSPLSHGTPGDHGRKQNQQTHY